MDLLREAIQIVACEEKRQDVLALLGDVDPLELMDISQRMREVAAVVEDLALQHMFGGD